MIGRRRDITIPRDTSFSLGFTRRRGFWTVEYTSLIAGEDAATVVKRSFLTKRGCHQFAARLGRNAAFFNANDGAFS